MIKLQTLLEAECVLCKKTAHSNHPALCTHCKNLLNAYHCCQQCGNTLKDENLNICGNCQTTPPAVDQTFCLSTYSPTARELIKQLKFNQQLLIADSLGKLLAQAIYHQKIPLPDIIIPVPMHKKRLRQRGFNQALQIAKPVSKQLSIHLSNSIAYRSIYTLPQTQLNASTRRTNPQASFHCKKISGEHIAIIDDVITTGSTVNTLAKILKKQGASRVSAWAIAHA
ncbi:MAG: Competence protein F homolog, phosphoribosyltransferase domain; protein YhgH required for utilization of DNA as sole source of carbon and energy [uncultured Thiotrichaceae bacterium]|uniref:Competence protein F homolog, phosphoribosyltransferase domain protein YhgH required for utilization of DNA as sole source of carbon and energy n=1 Tax=uncultured Thiotrichaceae bacterium TaxID=298394 RepID=A0A6S6SYQ8_9GAMM|nr:MAG: Competence protein F homolog, phosphoribosyltransferase domain; protein YhgH required for utilization of DNA as sole source of carbon and energy [uncultured Thiotrichaceae bacterium]